MHAENDGTALKSSLQFDPTQRKAVDLASGDLDINYVKTLKEATTGNNQYVIIDLEHLRYQWGLVIIRVRREKIWERRLLKRLHSCKAAMPAFMETNAAMVKTDCYECCVCKACKELQSGRRECESSESLSMFKSLY